MKKTKIFSALTGAAVLGGSLILGAVAQGCNTTTQFPAFPDNPGDAAIIRAEQTRSFMENYFYFLGGSNNFIPWTSIFSATSTTNQGEFITNVSNVSVTLVGFTSTTITLLAEITGITQTGSSNPVLSLVINWNIATETWVYIDSTGQTYNNFVLDNTIENTIVAPQNWLNWLNSNDTSNPTQTNLITFFRDISQTTMLNEDAITPEPATETGAVTSNGAGQTTIQTIRPFAANNTLVSVQVAYNTAVANLGDVGFSFFGILTPQPNTEGARLIINEIFVFSP